MKRVAPLTLALLLIPSAAYASRAYDLAGQPEAEVDDQNVCHITGAIWRDGPERNSRMVLRDTESGATFETMTDSDGIYHIAIPVSGRAVFRETNIGRRWTGSLPKAYCIRASVEVGELIPVPKNTPIR